MKILHVITGLGIGGAEQQLRLLAQQMAAETHVVTLTEPGRVAAGLRADGVPVTHLGMRGNRDVSVLPRLVRHIRSGRYDLVHTHLYRACLYGRLAARIAGVHAVVATEHSLGSDQIEGRALSRGTRALYLAGERLGRCTVAVSPSVAGRLEDWGVPSARIRVVPNGIDSGRFAFSAEGRRAARERLGVRFDALIRAVAAVPEARLVLVGEGAERARLLRTAQQCGADPRVTLTGACLDPPAPHAPAGSSLPDLLSAMDVFVSNSPDEAFGLAVVEALAAGLPVLYASCPAIADLPPDAVPAARLISGAHDELSRLLQDLSTAPPGRRAPADAVLRYDIAHSAQQLMSVYEDVLNRPVTPSR
jgi:glycosyltransferase involved in cell wall biosynthesis